MEDSLGGWLGRFQIIDNGEFGGDSLLGVFYWNSESGLPLRMGTLTPLSEARVTESVMLDWTSSIGASVNMDQRWKASSMLGGLRPVLPSSDFGGEWFRYCEEQGVDIVVDQGLLGTKSGQNWRQSQGSLYGHDPQAMFCAESSRLTLIDSLGNQDTATVVFALVDDQPRLEVTPVWIDSTVELSLIDDSDASYQAVILDYFDLGNGEFMLVLADPFVQECPQVLPDEGSSIAMVDGAGVVEFQVMGVISPCEILIHVDGEPLDFAYRSVYWSGAASPNWSFAAVGPRNTLSHTGGVIMSDGKWGWNHAGDSLEVVPGENEPGSYGWDADYSSLLVTLDDVVLNAVQPTQSLLVMDTVSRLSVDSWSWSIPESANFESPLVGYVGVGCMNSWDALFCNYSPNNVIEVACEVAPALYFDFDSDGIGSTVAEQVCIYDLDDLPEGHSLQQGDMCDDPFACNYDINVHQNEPCTYSVAWYFDHDGDGIGSQYAGQACSASELIENQGLSPDFSLVRVLETIVMTCPRAIGILQSMFRMGLSKIRLVVTSRIITMNKM